MRYIIDSVNKTISFEGGSIEEMRDVLTIFSNYTVTPLLDFPELNKSVSS